MTLSDLEDAIRIELKYADNQRLAYLRARTQAADENKKIMAIKYDKEADMYDGKIQAFRWVLAQILQLRNK